MAVLLRLGASSQSRSWAGGARSLVLRMWARVVRRHRAPPPGVEPAAGATVGAPVAALPGLHSRCPRSSPRRRAPIYLVACIVIVLLIAAAPVASSWRARQPRVGGPLGERGSHARPALECLHMRLKSGTYRVLWKAHAWARRDGVGAARRHVPARCRLLVPPRAGAVAGASAAHARGRGRARTMTTLQQWMDTRAWRRAPRRQLGVVLPAPHAPWLWLGWKEKDGSDVAAVHPLTGERCRSAATWAVPCSLLPLSAGQDVHRGAGGHGVAGGGVGAVVLQVGRFRRARAVPPRVHTAWGGPAQGAGRRGPASQARDGVDGGHLCLNATVMRPVMIHTAFPMETSGPGSRPTGYPGPLKRAGEAAPADVARAARAGAGVILVSALPVRLAQPGRYPEPSTSGATRGGAFTGSTSVRVSRTGRC